MTFNGRGPPNEDMHIYAIFSCIMDKYWCFCIYLVMADGFYAFERLEYKKSLLYSKKTPPPLMQLVISN